MTNLCQRCGTANPEQARYCRNCGAACDDAYVRSMTRLTPLLRQWRKISHKLTRKDIHKLLGEPAHRETTIPSAEHPSETWTYIYASSGVSPTHITGQVCFALPDGRVSFWSEPDWSQLPSSIVEAGKPLI